MIFYSDDPIADYARYDAHQQEYESRLPVCEMCETAIDDFLWEIDGEFLCDDCAKEKYRRSVD